MTITVKRIVRDSGSAADLVEALGIQSSDILAWMQQHTQVIKEDKYSCVGLFRLVDQPCYLKFYRSKSLLQSLVFQLGRGRAVSSFDMALQLAGKGISVPFPACVLLIDSGVLLLTQGFEDSPDLKSLWLSHSKDTNFHSVMGQAGTALGHFHSQGFTHGDCKWANFLWANEQFYFVDLEAVTSIDSAPARCRDLARFIVNAEDMGLHEGDFHYFVERYCDTTKQAQADVLTAVLPELNRLRLKHQKKYGERGHRLLP